MIETYRRIQTYQVKIQAIKKQGITFQDERELALFNQVKSDKAKLMYIIPDEPPTLAPAV